MKYILLLILNYCCLNVSFAQKDTLPLVTIVLQNDTLERQLISKINKYNQRVYFIENLTKDQIANFDSIYVKGYELVKFGGYAVSCGMDYWFNDKSSFDNKCLEHIRFLAECKETGFELFLRDTTNSKELHIPEFSIFDYRREK